MTNQYFTTTSPAPSAVDTALANKKIALVEKWIACNANQGVRAMVDKFNLSFFHEKNCGNGIAVVGFYTDCSAQFLVCKLHLASKDWFRA